MIAELVNKKNSLYTILDGIYVTFYEWIEKEIQMNSKYLIEIFKNVFQHNITGLLECEVKEDVLALEQIMNTLDDARIEVVKKFIVNCINVYMYDFIKDKNINSDKIYFNAVKSQYYIEKTLSMEYEESESKLFNSELKQINTLMNQYYESNELKTKSTVKSMILQKIKELFNRVDFYYSYPLLQ